MNVAPSGPAVIMYGIPAPMTKNWPAPVRCAHRRRAPSSTVNSPPNTIASWRRLRWCVGNVNPGRSSTPTRLNDGSIFVERHIAPSNVAATSTGAAASGPPSIQMLLTGRPGRWSSGSNPRVRSVAEQVEVVDRHVDDFASRPCWCHRRRLVRWDVGHDRSVEWRHDWRRGNHRRRPPRRAGLGAVVARSAGRSRAICGLTAARSPTRRSTSPRRSTGRCG